MALPFSREQFFEVFVRYNESVWPAQWLLIAAGLAATALALSKYASGLAVGWLLGALWAWMAVAYHFLFFASINPAAWIFGAAFLVQAGLTIAHARALHFGPPRGVDAAFGIALIAYAIAGYPAAGWLAGHSYPAVPTFGLPCPTTILTLGLLLVAERSLPMVLFVVPIAWSAIGSFAAFRFGVVQDYGLLAALLITLSLLVRRRITSPPPPASCSPGEWRAGAAARAMRSQAPASR